MLKQPEETRVMGVRSREKVLHEHTVGGYLDYVNELYDRASTLAEPLSRA
jgi:hypothetical protein